MTRRRDTGAWTRRQIQAERARLEAPRSAYVVTAGGEAKTFDTYREANDWRHLIAQSSTSVWPMIDEVRS